MFIINAAECLHVFGFSPPPSSDKSLELCEVTKVFKSAYFLVTSPTSLRHLSRIQICSSVSPSELVFTESYSGNYVFFSPVYNAYFYFSLRFNIFHPSVVLPSFIFCLHFKEWTECSSILPPKCSPYYVHITIIILFLYLSF